MDLLINISFTDFKKRVLTTIRENPGYTIENYQVDVGRNVLAFTSAYVERYNKRRMDWAAWLASQDFGEATEFFGDVSRHTATNTKNAEADEKWAFAFHFRMHGHFDGLEKHAWAIDELVFGERLDKRGKSVFANGQPEESACENRPEEISTSQTSCSERAPLTRPAYVTEEQAFIKNEHTAAIWLNPHNHHSLPLEGRNEELALLEEFINSGDRFKIAALIAPSGAGKTRLVSQWAKPYIEGDKGADWDAGFVDSPKAGNWNEDNWKPTKNTLIIIDYTYTYREVIGTIIKRFKNGAPQNIRLLVLDHVLPDKLHEDTAWEVGIPDVAFREANSELFFRKWPIALRPATDEDRFLRKIISAAADPFVRVDSEKKYSEDSPEIVAAAKVLMEIGAVDEAVATSDQIRRRDAVRHPLFAALFGQLLHENPKTNFSGMTRRSLISHYFGNSRRLPWHKDAENSELGYWVGLYVSAATLLRGVATNDILDFQDGPLETTVPVPEGRDFEAVLGMCGRIVSSGAYNIIKPFEPDILGENFVLKFLADKRTGVDYQTIAAALVVFSQSANFEDPVGSFLETIQRLVRNLIYDDQALEDVQGAWNSLLRFLDPKWFPDGSEIRQAVSIALGDLIKQRRKADHGDKIAAYALKINAGDLAIAGEGDRWLSAAQSVVHCLDCMLGAGRLGEEATDQTTLVMRNFKKRSKKHSPATMLATVEGCLHAAKHLKSTFNEDANSAQDQGWTILMVAAYFGHASIIEWLVDEGADPNLTGLAVGSTAFLIACGNNNLEAAKTLHGKGADIHATNKQLQNAANNSSRRGHLEVLKWLHSQQVDIHAKARFGGNAATEASGGGHLEVLKWLHSQQVDIHAKARFGGNAATVASRGGHLEVLKWLHSQKVDIHATESPGVNAVTEASGGGHLGVLKWLHSQQVDIHAKPRSGGNAVTEASRGGHLGVLKWLRSQKVDIHAKARFSENAVTEASRGGHLEVLKWLHSQQVDIQAMARSDGNAATKASRGGHLEVLKWLHSQQVDIHATDSIGGNAVTEASRGGHLDVLKWLHTQEVDIHARESTGGNAATVASRGGHLEVLKWLHSQQVDIHAKPRSGGNAVTEASWGGHLEVLKWLHSQKVDIHAKPRSGGNAVTEASPGGYLEVLKWLHAQQVDIHVKARLSGNAVTEASWGGHLDVLKWLHSQKVDIHATDSIGRNAATVASQGGHLDVLKWLHSQKVDIHAMESAGGNTAHGGQPGR